MLNGTMTRSPTLQVLHRRAHLVDHADELVPERHAHPGIGHHPVVEVQVRSADRRERHPHDRVIGMLDPGNVFFFDPDLVRSAVHHRPHECPLGGYLPEVTAFHQERAEVKVFWGCGRLRSGTPAAGWHQPLTPLRDRAYPTTKWL